MRSRLKRGVWYVGAIACLALSAAAYADDRQAEYIQLRLLVGQQQFAEALDRCRALIAKYPDYVYLYETLAEIALYAQDLDGAAKFFEQRVEDGTNLDLAYFGLGTVYFNMAAYREAALCFDRAIELGTTAPECYRNFVYAYERLEGVDASIRFFNSLCHRDPKNPHLWYAVALAYWSKRDYSTVLKNINEALSRNPSEPKYMQAKAAVLLLMGKAKEGAALTEKLINHAHQGSDLGGIQFLSSYEVLRQDRGQVPKLENELAQQSLETAKRFGQFRWIGWWYERLASLEYWGSLFPRAIKHSQIAFEASQKCSDNQLALDALIRQVESSMDLGQYDYAIEYAYKELDLSKKEKDNARIARSLCDLAWIYHELGLEDIAMDYAVESLSMTENTKATNELLMKIRATLGLIYEALGNSESALTNLTTADRLMPEGGIWVSNRAVSHGNIGRVFLRLGNLDKAIYHFSREYSLSRSSSFLREEAYSLVNLGDYYVCMHRPTLAKGFFTRAFTLSRTIGQRPTLLSSAFGLARLACSSGKYLEAIAWYDTAFFAAESMGLLWEGRLLADWKRNSFENELKEYVNLLVILGRNVQAFNFAERCKFSTDQGISSIARALDNCNNLPDSIRRAIVQVSKESQGVSCLPRLPKQLGMANGSRFDLNNLAEMVLTSVRNRRLLRDLREATSIGRTDWWPKASSLPEIQNALNNPSSGIVEYSVGEKYSLAFIVTKDALQVVRITAGCSELEAVVEGMANVFSDGSEFSHSWTANFANFDARACAEAYRKILGPVLRLIPSVDEITIIPDGILAGIPFECFVTDEKPDNSFPKEGFLVNKVALKYSNSATSINNLWRKDRSATQGLLALGNPYVSGAISELGRRDSLAPALLRPVRGLPPLPGAEREVRAIADQFEGRSTVLLGRDATKSTLKSLIPDYAIIHIAAHASINQECPRRSAIFLAPDREGGPYGLLRSSEFSATGINARLVVLSSCSTIKFFQGVDRAGFVRGLSEAGVPTIVGCLWSADDNSTAILMARFYHYLSRGEATARALQKAKIDLIFLGKVDPFYWAPFILVGDNVPIDVPGFSARRKGSWAFAGALGGLVCVAIMIFWIRRSSRTIVLNELLRSKKLG